MYKLRELERKDLKEINNWRNDKELIDFLGAPFRFINMEVDEKWYDSYMFNRQNCVRCAIVQENNDTILGLVSLTNIDYISRNAMFHIMIGRSENHGKGIGTYATTEMLRHAFENMNLHRVELEALSSNMRAINMYKKIGFVQEGVKRQAAYKNGSYTDMYVFSILHSELKASLSQMGGGDRLSTVSISVARNSKEKEAAILSCKTEFEKYSLDYNKIISKISASADVIIAYCDSIVGYCAMYANDYKSREAYITLIAVKKEWQKQYIGKLLLDSSLSLARDKGMKKIRLEVNNDNDNAIRFYQNNSFVYLNEHTDHNSCYMIRTI